MKRCSYKYAEAHIKDRFAKEYEEAKAIVDKINEQINPETLAVIPENVKQEGLIRQYHMILIQKGYEELPKKCSKCPMIDGYLSNGRLCFSCVMARDVYAPSMDDALHEKKRPEWCPLPALTKEVGENLC